MNSESSEMATNQDDHIILENDDSGIENKITLTFQFENPFKSKIVLESSPLIISNATIFKELLIEGLSKWCDENKIGKGRFNLYAFVTENPENIIKEGRGDIFISWTDDAWEKFIKQEDIIYNQSEQLCSQQHVIEHQEKFVETCRRDKNILIDRLHSIVSDQIKADDEHFMELNTEKNKNKELMYFNEQLSEEIIIARTKYEEELNITKISHQAELDTQKSDFLNIISNQAEMIDQLQDENSKLKLDLNEQQERNDRNEVNLDKQKEDILSQLKSHYDQKLHDMGLENLNLSNQLQQQNQRMYQQEKQALEDNQELNNRLLALEKQLKLKTDRIDAQAVQLGKLRTENAGLDFRITELTKTFRTETDRLNRRLETQGALLELYESNEKIKANLRQHPIC